jgi:hypothetical protein
VAVNLCDFFSHLYIDTYDPVVPDPNPLEALYLRFISVDDDFKFLGGGLGTHKEPRGNRSNEFGKAMCRWFLEEHFDMVHFAHMDHILDKDLDPTVGTKMRVVRRQRGDTPDYFCKSGAGSCYIAEAKGRYSAIDFTSTNFAEWRDQFDRIEVQDTHDRPFQTKGYIVATQFAREKGRPKVNQSMIFAEDPVSPGNPTADEPDGSLARAVTAVHFAPIFSKLSMTLFSVSLELGFVIRQRPNYAVQVWECLVPPYQGTQFAGGILPPGAGVQQGAHFIFDKEGHFVPVPILPGRGLIFFGLELGIFQAVCDIPYRGRAAADNVGLFQIRDGTPVSLSVRRDGTMLAPIDHVRFSGTLAI